MNIIDHGKWVSYVPEVWPKNLPSHVIFARRESDGVDWYEYSRAEGSFGKDTVKFIAHEQQAVGGWVIGAAVRDVSMLFPANAVVGEIADYDGTDPQIDFGNKFLDPKTMGIVPRPKPPGQRKDPFELVWDLEKRVEALEKKIK